MVKALILGASGMLGASILRRSLKYTAFEVAGTVRFSEMAKSFPSKHKIYTETSVQDIDTYERVIKDFKPNIVLNCIGIVKQRSKNISDYDFLSINGIFPHQLVEMCEHNGAKLIQFSTDCVFSGKTGNYSEGSPIDPVDIYGRSKFCGEIYKDGHLTLRTSIIGHEIFTSHSLVDWFINSEYPVNGFTNAVFSGLPTVCVADLLYKNILLSEINGLYHLSANPITKYQLLKTINEKYNLMKVLHKVNTPVIDRSLKSEKIRSELKIKTYAWEKMVELMKEEFDAYFKSE